MPHARTLRAQSNGSEARAQACRSAAQRTKKKAPNISRTRGTLLLHAQRYAQNACMYQPQKRKRIPGINGYAQRGSCTLPHVKARRKRAEESCRPAPRTPQYYQNAQDKAPADHDCCEKAQMYNACQRKASFTPINVTIQQVNTVIRCKYMLARARRAKIKASHKQKGARVAYVLHKDIGCFQACQLCKGSKKGTTCC